MDIWWRAHGASILFPISGARAVFESRRRGSRGSLRRLNFKLSHAHLCVPGLEARVSSGQLRGYSHWQIGEKRTGNSMGEFSYIEPATCLQWGEIAESC